MVLLDSTAFFDLILDIPVPLRMYWPSFWIGMATSALVVMLYQEDRLDSLLGELSTLLCVDENSLDSVRCFMRFRYNLLTPCFIVFAALSDIPGGVTI